MVHSDHCFLCNAKRDQRIALHRFPRELATRSAWIKFCGLSETSDNVKSLYLCSSHFLPTDYSEPRAMELGNRLRLLPKSVPSRGKRKDPKRHHLKQFSGFITGMKQEVPQVTVKQEKLDNFNLTTEPNVNYETEILDLPEIKLEKNHESCSDVFVPTNLNQELKLLEGTEMIGSDSNYMLDYSLYERQSNQQGSDIQPEESKEISEEIEIKKVFDFVHVRCKIENDEINIKEEKNVMDQEPR